MTNIEYYGFDNLEYINYTSNVGLKVCDIYYIPRHAKKHVLLKTINDTSDKEMVKKKTKWLLEEVKFPYNDFGDWTFIDGEDGLLRLYTMKHCVGGRFNGTL